MSLIGVAVATHGAGVIGNAIKNFSKHNKKSSGSNEEKLSGGGKNAQHVNQKAKEIAQKKHLEAKEELKKLRSQSPINKKQIKELEKQIKHWQNKKNSLEKIIVKTQKDIKNGKIFFCSKISCYKYFYKGIYY